MSGWEQAGELAEQFSGGNFIQLKDDGDSFMGMFLGEPYPWECWYNKAANRYESFGPEQATKGIKKGMRFGVSVLQAICSASGEWSYEVKAWEVTVMTLKAMLEVKKKYGFDRFYEVKRKGKKDDTKTTYTVLPEDAPSAELLAYCKAIPPMDLAPLYIDDKQAAATEGAGQQQFQPGAAAVPATAPPAATAPPPATAPPATAPATAAAPPPAAATAPAAPQMGAPATAPAAAAAATSGAVDHQTIHALSVVLKECPNWKQAAADFCGHFGIQKIKDVPAAKKDEAIALATSIAASQAPPETPVEVDPFEN